MNTAVALAAVEGGSSMSQTVISSLSGTGSEILGVISGVAPAGLTIVGAFLVWKVGVKFFKSIAKG
jgi:hypothetical protein